MKSLEITESHVSHIKDNKLFFGNIWGWIIWDFKNVKTILYLIFFIKIFLVRFFFIRIFLIWIIWRKCYIINQTSFFSLITYLHSSKNTYKRLQANTLRTFFWYFITVEICVGFFLMSCYFSFRIFFIAYRFTIKSCFMLLSTLSQILLYISNKSLSFIKKDIYLVSPKFFSMHSF